MFTYSDLQGHYLSHKISLEGVDAEAFTKSLTAARVDMNPHQVDASLFALRSPLTKGVLLADEVGLGKTIEAGLVMAQKWAEQKRRILLVVPASLRKQWEQELIEKFGLASRILEAKTYRDLKKAGTTQPFRDVKGIIIASYEFAARHADTIRAIAWDLVVFDEAHRLRNVYKKNGSIRAKTLKDAVVGRPKVLLTATPLQNSLMELYGIVSVADDNHFGGEAAFRSQYAGARTSPAALDGLRQRLEVICHRTLRRQVQEAGHINFTKRNAVVFDFEPPSLEVQLYDLVSGFLQRKDTISYGDRSNALVILQVRKILGSSTFAVARYLEQLIARLRKKQRASVSMTDDIDSFDETEEEFDEDEGGEDEGPIDPVQLENEILELQSYLDLANSIGKNAKGEKLLSQLPRVLDEIVARGGQRKAVIFTESVRTQTYLSRLLSDNGYAGKIVLLNGSNNDPVSKDLYADWKARHAGTDRVSGSRTADMKAAIVEAFRGDDKTILIATESGAEGINLQFCSLLINFDLPWNPQRIEQRIGRCHRYGQKIDVTVVNMLNRKNMAEARIYELLREKFQLFDGVFGSSDEVLGAIENGVDFEKTVLGIVQQCRTEEEINREFDSLTGRLQDSIDADLQSARSKLLEHMDQDVVSRLKDRKSQLDVALNDFTRRLLLIARAELDGIAFDRPDATEFQYRGQTYSTNWPLADENDWQFFRLAEGTLATRTVEGAMARDHATDIAAIAFDESLYPFAGRLGDVRDLKGRSGWLMCHKAWVRTSQTLREELLLACLTDDGEIVAPATADRMLLAPSEPAPRPADAPPARLDEVSSQLFDGFLQHIRTQNSDWLDEEERRLEDYARDVEVEIDARIDEIEREVDDLRRQRRSPDLSMEEKLTLGRQIKRLEGDIDDLKLTKHEKRREIRRQVSDMLDEIADSLNRPPERRHLFTLRWSVV
ncbi:MAG TPA: SNF2-related protein [Devosiaceae bacterium]